MKIFYFSFTRFPSEKAHSLYLAKTCESLALEKCTVKLIVPKRFNDVSDDYRAFYRLDGDFSVSKIPCIDLFKIKVFRPVAIFVGLFSFSLASSVFAILKVPRNSIVISNDAFLCLCLTFFCKTVVCEIHDYPGKFSFIHKKLFKRAKLIQTNNKCKQLLLNKDFSVPYKKMFAAHNGVTVEDFDVRLTKDEARDMLSLNKEKELIVYTGHLYGWKGVDTLLDAATKMKDKDFIFVGGNSEDVQKKIIEYQNNKNIFFLGFKRHVEMPIYQRAADILVVPNTGKVDISLFHTSPMKIFEYMSSKTLIVASAIPSIKEILDDDCAIFFNPDSAKSLISSLNEALSLHSDQKQRLVNNAFLKVQNYTWKKRAQKLVEIYSKINE